MGGGSFVLLMSAHVQVLGISNHSIKTFCENTVCIQLKVRHKICHQKERPIVEGVSGCFFDKANIWLRSLFVHFLFDVM